MAGKIKQIWLALSDCFRANGQPLTRAQVVAWIGVHYQDSEFNPVTLKAQLDRSCANVQWAEKYNAPKILYFDRRTKKYSLVDGHAISPMETPEPDGIQDQVEIDDEGGLLEPEDQSDLLVGVEAQLRDYLAKNLGKLEKGLTFWTDSPPSVEYVIEGKRIDILAKDSDGVPVVVELKRGKAYDRVVGQALLYQALVSSSFKTPRVRIILVANEISIELRLASSRQADFKLFEYELTMQLNPVASVVSNEEEV